MILAWCRSDFYSFRRASLTAGLLRKLLIVSGGLLSCEQLPGGVVALGCGGGMPFSSQRV
jgi:hypothetical protein